MHICIHLHTYNMYVYSIYIHENAHVYMCTGSSFPPLIVQSGRLAIFMLMVPVSSADHGPLARLRSMGPETCVFHDAFPSIYPSPYTHIHTYVYIYIYICANVHVQSSPLGLYTCPSFRQAVPKAPVQASWICGSATCPLHLGHYTILYYTILYYTILYYTILYYTILYYSILYYTILYYPVL